VRGHPSGGRLAIIELREIACDESGYEGESLVGGVTDVFAHAGVHLTSTAAAGCVEQLRRRIRSPALEYQANHLLREKNRRALEWLLGVDGPIHGHAHVHLVDKTLFLIGKIVELVAGTTRRPSTSTETGSTPLSWPRPTTCCGPGRARANPRASTTGRPR